MKGCGSIDVISFHTINFTRGGECSSTRFSGYVSIWWLLELLAVFDAAVWLTTRPGVVPETVSDLRAKEMEAIVTRK